MDIDMEALRALERDREIPMNVLIDALEDAISRAAFLARFVPNGGSCPLPKAVK